MNVILYSTHCPMCNVLEQKLKSVPIEFTEENDIDVMVKKGFMSAPILEVDGKCMNFAEAVKWVNDQEVNK